MYAGPEAALQSWKLFAKAPGWSVRLKPELNFLNCRPVAGTSPGTILPSGRFAGAGPGAALGHGPDFLPSGLRNASTGLKDLFINESIRGSSIIDMRSTLLNNGFVQSLTRNRSGYLFKNILGEELRIMNRNGLWDVRLRNQFGNFLDEFGNVGEPSLTHSIQVFSK
jgi:hypothetical protein